jgi:hypothetical protein
MGIFSRNKPKPPVKTETSAPPASENTFEYGGKKFKALRAASIPLADGAMKMTAADIVVSAEAQKYLVENKCSCIEEVIE